MYEFFESVSKNEDGLLDEQEMMKIVMTKRERRPAGPGAVGRSRSAPTTVSAASRISPQNPEFLTFSDADGSRPTALLAALRNRLPAAVSETSEEVDALTSISVKAEESSTDEVNLRRIKSAKKDERREILDGWQLMYCGGAAPVVAELKKLCSRYGMPLKTESFDW
jgi:hypothetical protein